MMMRMSDATDQSSPPSSPWSSWLEGEDNPLDLLLEDDDDPLPHPPPAPPLSPPSPPPQETRTKDAEDEEEEETRLQRALAQLPELEEKLGRAKAELQECRDLIQGIRKKRLRAMESKAEKTKARQARYVEKFRQIPELEREVKTLGDECLLARVHCGSIPVPAAPGARPRPYKTRVPASITGTERGRRLNLENSRYKREYLAWLIGERDRLSQYRDELRGLALGRVMTPAAPAPHY
jgi:hypothetical protein